jgi:hypothetical protein
MKIKVSFYPVRAVHFGGTAAKFWDQPLADDANEWILNHKWTHLEIEEPGDNGRTVQGVGGGEN